MGYLYSPEWKSPADVRAAINQETHLRLLDQAATNRGLHLWSLYETPKGERFIQLDLIEKAPDGSYGYKDIDESMGPFYHDCPLRLLRAAGPTTSKTAQEWRNRVREAHKRSR